MARRTRTLIDDDAGAPAPAAEAPAKPRGRPSAASKAAAADLEALRAAAPPKRMAPRPVREMPRESVREHNTRGGAVVIEGRNGEILTRRRTTVGDIHHVPPEEIPRGWDYQWNAVTVVGKELREEQMVMQQNGWRPVPASRHEGRWTEPGYDGEIVVRGLRLEERPTALGNEARAEDNARARAQVRDQVEALQLSKKMPKGMEVSGKYRGTGADVRMSIDPALDVPRPSYQEAED